MFGPCVKKQQFLWQKLEKGVKNVFNLHFSHNPGKSHELKYTLLTFIDIYIASFSHHRYLNMTTSQTNFRVKVAFRI